METELEFACLQLEDYPECFTLDFDPGIPENSPRILLGVAKNLLDWIINILEKTPVFEQYTKMLGPQGVSSKFLCDTKVPWGFGEVIIPTKSEGEFMEFSMNIPPVEENAGPCTDCDGSGENKTYGVECIRCMGGGIEWDLDWQRVTCLSATFSLLSTFLHNPHKDILPRLSKNRQLLSVQTYYSKESSFIGAVLSSSFGSFLRHRSNTDLPYVREATKLAYLKMFPSYARFDERSGYEAYIRDNGQLIINVPGDACGLFVDGFSDSLHENAGPMELSCHNVDSPVQQIALLAGLAALSGKARKILYGDPQS